MCTAFTMYWIRQGWDKPKCTNKPHKKQIGTGAVRLCMPFRLPSIRCTLYNRLRQEGMATVQTYSLFLEEC